MPSLQVSDSPQKSKKQTSRSSGGADKPSGAKRSKKACVTGEGSENDTGSTSASSTPKKGAKEARKKKTEDNLSMNTSKQESTTQVKHSKANRDNSKDVEICRYHIRTLEANTHG